LVDVIKKTDENLPEGRQSQARLPSVLHPRESGFE